MSASGIIEPDVKHIGAHDKLRGADPKEQVSPCVARNHAISIGFKASGDYPRQSGNHIKALCERIWDHGNPFAT